MFIASFFGASAFFWEQSICTLVLFYCGVKQSEKGRQAVRDFASQRKFIFLQKHSEQLPHTFFQALYVM